MILASILTAILLWTAGCTAGRTYTLITIADARSQPAQVIDVGDAGDSPGDLLVFDQPLRDVDMQEIGTNSGVCIRTRPAHSFQCQWTLTLENGTITVAGREFDTGTSLISIIGGTGDYAGISGVMESTNNNDGTFTQTLRYKHK
ncbi:MAG: dirigent protein [Halobacteria archaeon]|nr:dirigent protein [Halobacteria archaeon]